MATVDNVLRGLAAITAVAAIGVVAANPQFRADSGVAAAQRIAGDPDARQAGARTDGYSFLLKSEDSRYPGRWCAGDIPYTLDLTQAQLAGMDAAAEATRWATVLQRWAVASQGHYRFTYAGQRTLQTKPDGEIDLESVEPGTIGITYVHDDPTGESGYQAAAVRGRTAGNGGLQVTSNASLPGGTLVGDRGFVMIDAQDAAALSPDGLRQALYQHESGHALGLGHVNSPTSIMNGTLSSDREELAQGDLAGLRAITAMPCQK